MSPEKQRIYSELYALVAIVKPIDHAVKILNKLIEVQEIEKKNLIKKHQALEGVRESVQSLKIGDK